MSRNVKLFRISNQFSKNTDGVAAIEFALLAPLFFALTFAILELLLYMISSMWLENGTQFIESRLREIKNSNNSTQTDVAQLRQELCTNFGGLSVLTDGCADGRLRVGLWASGGNRTNFADTPEFPIPGVAYITPNARMTREDIWTIGLEIDWPFILPTTRLLRASPGGKSIDHIPGPPTMATVRTSIVPTELVADPLNTRGNGGGGPNGNEGGPNGNTGS